MIKKKGRSASGQFINIPHVVMETDDYRSLRGSSVKLLNAMLKQYNGRNNGDLTAAWKVMQVEGFKSKSTLNRARQQLEANGLILKTRAGYFQNPGGRCDLFAITWKPIDECPGKQLEVSATNTPPRKFSIEKN